VIVTDVNVLVYAFRDDAVDHAAYRDWLQAMTESAEPFAIADLVLSGFLRVVTNRRVFVRPSKLDQALAFASALRDRENAVVIRPGPRHWEIFEDLLGRTGATGDLVPDAYLAALAIETGSEFITTDLDFSRFPGLRWRHPLRAA
jgi:toxin-antitoxin system PIN domain toxin